MPCERCKKRNYAREQERLDLKEHEMLVINEFRKIQDDSDLEAAHKNADRQLCAFLLYLGFKDIVEEYEKIGKWYS